MLRSTLIDRQRYGLLIKLRNSLRSTRGAVDLASIMVGLIVLGIVAAFIIIAAVAGVVPWSQNRTAQINLDAVKTAESVQRAQAGRYIDYSGLKTAGYLQSRTRLAVGTNAAGTCWVGVSQSVAGPVYTSNDADPTPTVWTVGQNSTCTDLTPLLASIGVVPPPPVFGTLTSTTSSNATSLPWRTAASSADGKKLLLAAGGGGLYRSTDGGATVSLLALVPPGGSWSTLASSGDGRLLFAADSYKYIYRSADGGATWTQLTALGMSNWNDIAVTPDGTSVAIVSGWTKTVLVSADSGVTFQTRTLGALAPSFVSLSTIGISDNGKKLISNNSSTVIISGDGGLTWTAPPTAGLWNFDRVAISGDGSTYVAQWQTNTFVSKNGRTSWTTYAHSGGGGGSSVLEVSTDGKKILARDFQSVQISIDAGVSWRIYNQPQVAGYSATMSTDGARIIVAPSPSNNPGPLIVYTWGP